MIKPPPKYTNMKERYHHIIHHVTYLLGITFILSSIFKWIGLKTFAITVNDFCVFLDFDLLYGHGMTLAITICSAELLLGIAAFVPRLRDYVVWIYLIVMGSFTHITYLNLKSLYGQIESCGCFGEVIHLTPSESFYKNLVLLILSIIACALSVFCKNGNKHVEEVDV